MPRSWRERQPISRPARSPIANGPIDIPNFVTTASTCCGSAPSNRSLSDSLIRCASMRLPTKPSQTRTTAGTFAILREIETAVIKRVRRGRRGPHDLAQLHHVGRREEVHAEHVLRTFCLFG